MVRGERYVLEYCGVGNTPQIVFCELTEVNGTFEFWAQHKGLIVEVCQRGVDGKVVRRKDELSRY